MSEQTPQPEQVPETDPAPAVEAAETEASVTEAVTRSPVRDVRSPFTVATA